jgi:hypothetical protein
VRLHRYRLHGLRIASEIPLPELSETTDDAAEVVFKLGHVPKTIPHVGATTEGGLISEHCALITVPDVASYLVERGFSITIELARNTDLGVMRFYLLGAASVSLLFQRGEFPFHAAAAARHKGAIAFLGFSMAGKSTLCGALSQRGWQLLTDDRLVLRKWDRNYLAVPSVPVLNLTTPSAGSIGIGEDRLLRSTTNYGKRIYRGSDWYVTGSALLRALVFLEWNDCGTRIDPLDSFEALIRLREQVNYESHLRLLQREDAFFELATSLALTVPAFQLSRPKSFSALPEVLDALEALYGAVVIPP